MTRKRFGSSSGKRRVRTGGMRTRLVSTPLSRVGGRLLSSFDVDPSQMCLRSSLGGGDGRGKYDKNGREFFFLLCHSNEEGIRTIQFRSVS